MCMWLMAIIIKPPFKSIAFKFTAPEGTVPQPNQQTFLTLVTFFRLFFCFPLKFYFPLLFNCRPSFVVFFHSCFVWMRCFAIRFYQWDEFCIIVISINIIFNVLTKPSISTVIRPTHTHTTTAFTRHQILKKVGQILTLSIKYTKIAIPLKQWKSLGEWLQIGEINHIFVSAIIIISVQIYQEKKQQQKQKANMHRSFCVWICFIIIISVKVNYQYIFTSIKSPHEKKLQKLFKSMLISNKM